MYVNKTPPNSPQNTPFPGLNLIVGKMNYRLGNLNPTWAKCLKSGQNFSRSRQKNIFIIHCCQPFVPLYPTALLPPPCLLLLAQENHASGCMILADQRWQSGWLRCASVFLATVARSGDLDFERKFGHVLLVRLGRPSWSTKYCKSLLAGFGCLRGSAWIAMHGFKLVASCHQHRAGKPK